MVDIECLGAWPDTLTQEEANAGEEVGIDYKLTNPDSTEKEVSVRGYIGSHTAAVHGENVPPNGGTTYGTVFIYPTGVRNGEPIRVEITDVTDLGSGGSGSGSGSDSGGSDGGTDSGSSGDGAISVDRVDVSPSTVGVGDWLNFETYVSSTLSQSASVTATTYLAGTLIDQHTTTLDAGESTVFPRHATYDQLIEKNLGGVTGDLYVSLLSDAPIDTSEQTAGTVTVTPRLELVDVGNTNVTVTSGETVQFQADVRNNGSSAQSATVAWYLDGEQATSRTQTVESGATETLADTVSYEFLLSSFGEGSYTLSAELGRQSMTWGTISVEIQLTKSAPRVRVQRSATRAFDRFRLPIQR